MGVAGYIPDKRCRRLHQWGRATIHPIRHGPDGSVLQKRRLRLVGPFAGLNLGRLHAEPAEVWIGGQVWHCVPGEPDNFDPVRVSESPVQFRWETLALRRDAIDNGIELFESS